MHLPRFAPLGFGVLGLGLALGLPVLATTQAGPLLVRVTTSPNPYAIQGATSVSHSIGVLGDATGTTDVALEGYATQPGSVGLEGFSSATSGTASNGVYGYSSTGSGLYGAAGAKAAFALYAASSSANGTAVQVNSTGGGALGMQISAPALDAYGLDVTSGGNAITAYGSTGIGVYGQTDAPSSVPALEISAVDGVDSSANGNQIGVSGISNAGYGVEGTSSEGTAVFGSTTDENGIGGLTSVYGYDMSTVSTDAGVQGSTTNGRGVIGGAGGTGTGVYAESFSGTAVEAVADGNNSFPTALHAVTGGDGYSIVASRGSTDVMTLDSNGNMTLAGSVTTDSTPNSTVRDATGAKRVAYAQRATESTLEDFGQGQLHAGVAYVALDPVFSSTLDPRSNYLVFVEAGGPNGGTYVSEKTARGFFVHASGSQTMSFDYRIVGRARTDRAESRLGLYHSALLNVPHERRERGISFRPSRIASVPHIRRPERRAVARTLPSPTVVRPSL